MYICTQNYDLKRGGTFETAKAGTFHSVTAGTSIPLFTIYSNNPMIRLGGWGLIFVGLAEIFDMALGNPLGKILMMLVVDDMEEERF